MVANWMSVEERKGYYLLQQSRASARALVFKVQGHSTPVCGKIPVPFKGRGKVAMQFSGSHPCGEEGLHQVEKEVLQGSGELPV